MNIFYLHEDPILAARDLCDQHILKMGIESAQMLSTAHWATGGQAPYKKAHLNHPSTKWVRESIQHYRWLVYHAEEIFNIYTKHYGRVHKTQGILEWLKQNEPKIPDNGFYAPPQCMPDEYKQENAVDAYRTFYTLDKIVGKQLTYNRVKAKPEWLYS